jgi:cation-transporting ATPase 13A2
MEGQPYSNSVHSRFTLFSGTSVIQVTPSTEGRCSAMVFRTGFSTARGELIRSILYPRPYKFSFESDSYKFMAILVSLASLGIVYSVFQFIHLKAGINRI